MLIYPPRDAFVIPECWSKERVKFRQLLEQRAEQFEEGSLKVDAFYKVFDPEDNSSYVATFIEKDAEFSVTTAAHEFTFANPVSNTIVPLVDQQMVNSCTAHLMVKLLVLQAKEGVVTSIDVVNTPIDENDNDECRLMVYLLSMYYKSISHQLMANTPMEYTGHIRIHVPEHDADGEDFTEYQPFNGPDIEADDFLRSFHAARV